MPPTQFPEFVAPDMRVPTRVIKNFDYNSDIILKEMKEE